MLWAMKKSRKTSLRLLHVLNSVAKENILEVFSSFKQENVSAAADSLCRRLAVASFPSIFSKALP